MSLGGCTSTPPIATYAGRTEIPEGSSLQRAQLLHYKPEPYFYFRPLDFKYVILLSPETLIAAFARYPSPGPSSSLLDALQRDIPLSTNRDLFAYVLDDPDSFASIQYLLFELLSHGEAAVLNSTTGTLAPYVEIDNSADGYCRARPIYVNGEFLWGWRNCDY